MKKMGRPRVHNYPNQYILRRLFRYETEFSGGRLQWKMSKGSKGRGFHAGSEMDTFRKIVIDGKAYNERDLVWIYHYGALPLVGLMNLDGDAFNNKIANIKPRDYDPDAKVDIVQPEYVKVSFL